MVILMGMMVVVLMDDCGNDDNLDEVVVGVVATVGRAWDLSILKHVSLSQLTMLFLNLGPAC